MWNYIPYLPPQNSSHALRIVGFVEYSVALNSLDKFLTTATPGELKIAEGIIEERPEFTIYTNLSRKWQGTNSFLSEKGGNDSYTKRGLKWMTALARVEVGAVLAGFTSVPSPFAVKPPTKYDRDEYEEIILDGFRSLYWTILADPVLNNYSQSAIPKDLLIIEYRRIALARAMGAIGLELMQSKLTPVQIAEARSWDQRLQQLGIVVTYCIVKVFGTRPAEPDSVMSRLGCPNMMSNIMTRERAEAIVEKNKQAAELNKYNSWNFIKLQLEEKYWQILNVVKCE